MRNFIRAIVAGVFALAVSLPSFAGGNLSPFALLGIPNTWAQTQTFSPAVNSSALAVSGYSLTGTDTHSLIDLAGTWNVGTTVETALKLNMLDTASGATSLLADLQLGGASKFKFSKAGDITLNNTGAASIVSSFVSALIYFGNPATLNNGFGVYGNVGFGPSVRLDSALSLAWNSGGAGSGADTGLWRDAIGIVAQRNSTNAQVYRVYNTFTSAANEEDFGIDWQTTANTATIGPHTVGGTLRNVNATSAWSFATTIQTKQIFTVATLPTCNAGAEGTRSGVSDALGPVFLTALVGGGAVHTPAYCNGTTWIAG